MRPLRMKMTAFGPYKDAEVIDFSELGEHRLFVISGNTGAGKTSIFDAISFAVYGEASGEDRNETNMLRSQFADDDVPTSVEFEFILRGRSYRVLRQLAHIKEGNKSATGDKYEFYETTDSREVPLTDRFIVTQVNDKIREVIGLTKDQFSQIVMLPQGEFRKLLTSETENKEEILRRIFKTNIYKVVSERLNDKRKDLQKGYEAIAKEREIYIHNLQAGSFLHEGSLLQAVFAQSHYNTTQIIEALDKENANNKGEIKKLKSELMAADAILKERTAKFHQAQHINERFDDLDNKKRQRDKLIERKTDIESNESQVALAEKAEHLQPYELQHIEMQKDVLVKRDLLETYKARVGQVEAALQEAKELYEQALNDEDKRVQTGRELDQLLRYLPTVQQLDQKLSQVKELESLTTALTAQLSTVERKISDDTSRRTQLIDTMKPLEKRTGSYANKLEKLSEMREQAAALQSVVKLFNKVKLEETELQQTLRLFTIADESYLRIEAIWLNGQSSLLASHLHEGKPCPVCGSAEHPRKASLSIDMPTEEQLNQQRHNRAEAEVKFFAADASLNATKQQLQDNLTNLADLYASGLTNEEAVAQFAIVKAEGISLKQEVDQLKAEQDQLNQLKQQLDTLEHNLEKKVAEKDTLTKNLHVQQASYLTEKAVYDHSLASIDEHVRSLKQLEQRIQTVTLQKEQLETQWKVAQDRLKITNDQYIATNEQLKSVNEQWIEARLREERSGNSFIMALTQAGFASEETYHQAKMTETDQLSMKQAIEQYNTLLSTVTQQIVELTLWLTSKEKYDLSILAAELNELNQQMEHIRHAHTKAINDYEYGMISKENIVTAEEKVKVAEQKLLLVKDLYDVVRGENDKKISFERYLQIEFLEMIIQEANQRFIRISGGQYYLVRSERLEKRGRQSGLGLDVYDNYTGQLRDVKTLSGGEKFNASLCLALGMADVIQSYEGGISIETMFIDEGFGSLDEETLNKAIDTLVELQLTGRMIGVISHVEELKQTIPAILEVKKTKEGHSHTTFIVS